MRVSVTLDEGSYHRTLLALERFGKDAEKAIKGAVDATALAVETDAKEKIKEDGHIVTGRLRASIHAELKPNRSFTYRVPMTKKGQALAKREQQILDGGLKHDFGPMEAIAGTNVEYGPFIEFERDSYLRFASEKQKEPFRKRVADAINKLINEGAKK